jgi:hypothetical protein
MGIEGLLEFKKMLVAMKRGDFREEIDDVPLCRAG